MFFNIQSEQISYIKNKDVNLSKYIDKYGDILVEVNPNFFEAIVLNIISQQLSKKAANTIINRFEDIVREIKPDTILNTDSEQLRGCGISYNKIKFIKELALKISTGEYHLDNLDNMNDEELITYLMKIKGVGRWTAEMIAIFSLQRLDIFSYDDVALRNAIMKVHSFKTLSKIRFERLRKRYSPYSTIASLYYYHIIDND